MVTHATSIIFPRPPSSAPVVRPKAAVSGDTFVCQRAERGVWVPAGWYLLERAPGGKGRHLRLGLYCSVACLIAAGQMLEEGRPSTPPGWTCPPKRTGAGNGPG
ncbi:hypothetical protein AB0J63_20945 [Streptosporangium canum]|uniref:hypothetical protein n=1 Tax=Streptosporangium canum TaxID=324952 RepID=UPI00341AA810